MAGISSRGFDQSKARPGGAKPHGHLIWHGKFDLQIPGAFYSTSTMTCQPGFKTVVRHDATSLWVESPTTHARQQAPISELTFAKAVVDAQRYGGRIGRQSELQNSSCLPIAFGVIL
jgi:hypothetical protein